MPIDTSSYYPEVPSPDGKNDGYSLNKREGGLFDTPKESKPLPEKDSTENPKKDEAPQPDLRSKDDNGSSIDRGVTIFSNIISWLFVPLLMPVYGLILAFGLSILDLAPFGMRVKFTLIATGINVVIPMILIVLLKKMGFVEDLGLNGRKERLIPYIITIISFGITAWFMAIKGAPIWLWLFFAGGALAGLINLLINFRWKISAHAAGIAGIVALLIRIAKDGSPEPELFTWLIISILLSGLLGSARVWLGRHTVWQVLAGYVVGFCCVFFITMIH